MLDKKQEHAIARVVTSSGNYLGTAFFVSPRAALTCHHVVKNHPQDCLHLVGPWAGAEAVAVSAVRSHPDAEHHQGSDLAVLEIDAPKKVAENLTLHAGWPAAGDRVIVYGYSTKNGALEPRTLDVVAYDTVSGMFSLQDLAAPGISGGPVVNGIGHIVGLAALINNRHLTYIVPIFKMLSFLRSVNSVDIGPPRKFTPPSTRDKLHAGLSSALGSLHLHIDGGSDRKIAVDTVKLIDPTFARSEVATINAAVEGPLRIEQPDRYADHTPGQNGQEQFHFFTTTTLHPGPADPDSIETAEIEDQVRNVLGCLNLAVEKGISDARSGHVVEVERVVGSVARNGEVRWVPEPSLQTMFRAGFLFEKQSGDALKNDYEVHISLDIPRNGSDEPPLTLEMLLEVCDRAKVPVGGWFIFSKPDFWAYRSNALMTDVDQATAVRMRNDLNSELSRLHGLDLSGKTLRVLVEESLGIWKTKFNKLNDTALTVPELAAWEGGQPSGSEVWIVTGNFLGDHNVEIENAMLRNLGRGNKYVYFLRSFSDLSRWLRFRRNLDKKRGEESSDQMKAFVYEFGDPKIWKDKLDCFIAFPPEAQPEGYRLSRSRRTGRVIVGEKMSSEHINNICKMLQSTMLRDEVVSTRRFTQEEEVKGAIVWLDFGLFERFMDNQISREVLGKFLEDFDSEGSIYVSRCDGETIRSNEVGFVVLLPSLGLGLERESIVATQALRLLHDLRMLCDKLNPLSGQSPVHRSAIEYGLLRRIIRSNGRAVDGDPLRDCRAKAAKLPEGQSVALNGMKIIMENAGGLLGVRVGLKPDGTIDWH